MPRAKETGRSPNTQPCPRCGTSVAYWWNGRSVEHARHKVKGRWCRQVRAPRKDLDVREKGGAR